MSTKISNALSASGVIAYHHEEYAANYSSYYSESGKAAGVWFGKEAEAFGLVPGTPVEEEPFKRLANGQDPNTGLQLIEWRTAPGQNLPAWATNDGVWREYLEDIAAVAASRKLEGFYERVDGAKLLVDLYGDTPVKERAKVAGELMDRYGLWDDPFIREKRGELPKPGEQSKWVEHRAAWDMNIGAPKTISLTALVGSDERVRKLWNEAVWEGASYAERAIQVKMGGLSHPQTTGRMVAALFHHDTARPVDGYPAPHLHGHLVVFNMSQDRDGQYRALNPRELFYLQSAVDSVVMNRLAVGLKGLGYEIEYGKNLAIEIKGYTQEYRDAESQRTAQIERKKAELGMFGPGTDQNVQLSTRARKLDLSSDQVRALHLEHAATYGNQPQQVVAAAQLRKGVTYSPEYRTELSDEAVQFAKARLSERTTVMEWYEIHRDALRFGRGYITLPDVEQGFARARERGEFQGVSHWRNYAPESRWTTPELEAKEREILGWMATGRGRAGAIAGGITKDEFRDQFRDHLNDGQKHLVWNLIHANDRMVGVQGIAGSGKTRALATVRDFAEAYGYEVRGVAATSGAVAELRRVGIAADTLSAHRLKDEKPAGPRLYLVDEASLTDVHQMSAFLRGLKPADRVIVIGDTRQHGSLGAGRMFAELQEAGMETFHLKKIVRQQDENYRQVVQDLSRGQIAHALEKLEDRARIHEFRDERLRYKAIGTWYLRDPEHTLVVSPDNRSRVAISDAIRSARMEAGQLGEVYRARVLEPRSGVTAEDLRFAGSYRVGDVLVYARNSKGGLGKGDRASVVQMDRDHNQVTVMREKDGKIITYNPRRQGGSATVYEPNYREFAAGDRVQFTRPLGPVANRALGTLQNVDSAGNVTIRLDDGARWGGNLEKMPHLDHGYVQTSYTAQGSTAERVLVHLDTDAPGVSRMVNQQLIYVAASRGRQEVQVFVNSREGLAEALMRREEKATALAPEEISRYQTVAASRGLSR